MRILIISSSLNPSSRSRAMAEHSRTVLTNRGIDAGYLDLQNEALPLCDGASCYDNPRVQSLAETIRDCDGVLIATPIYNYGASASIKNFVELTGAAWTNKVVGFLCAAGGPSSYMAIMGLANSLMLDFRSIVIPRFVYTRGDAEDNLEIADDAIDERIRELAETVVKVASALRNGLE
jgi:FMN reductase